MSMKVAELVRYDLPRAVALDGAIVTSKSMNQKGEFHGEVYDRKLQLVPESLRPSSKAMRKHVPVVPSRLQAMQAETFPGRYLFAGFVYEMFGHDLVEFTSRLWPLLEDKQPFDGIVAIQWRHDSAETQTRLMEPNNIILKSLGINCGITLVGRQPKKFEQLVVPEPMFHINDFGLSGLKTLFDTISDRIARDSPNDWLPESKLYLSRRRFGGNQRTKDEDVLENMARKKGYTVIHPQSLTFQNQVCLARKSTAMAGMDGSAMHLAAFCKPGTPVTCFDLRHVQNQYILEALAGVKAKHVNIQNLSRDKLATLESEFVS